VLPTTLADVAEAMSGDIVKGAPDGVITSVSADSRSVAVGDLFIPLAGDRFDGHDYIGSALDAGAAAAVTAQPLTDDVEGRAAAVIRVDDTLRALTSLASAVRDRVSGPVVAITGSNGKTSTKELAAAVLGPSAHKAPESYNNAIGVALTLLGVDAADAPVVLEMGTNHFGEIAALVDIARPDVGVFLNAAAVHTEFLVDVDGVAREKSALPVAAARAVLNAADKRVMRYAPDCADVTTFGVGENADVGVTGVTVDALGRPSFSLRIDGVDVGTVTLRLLGRHQVGNALAAAAVGHILGVSPQDIVERLRDADAAKMRMQVERVGEVTIVNDAYNANPASVRAAFETFRDVAVDGDRWVLLGDMLELGQGAAELHGDAARLLSADWCAGFIPHGEHAGVMAEAARPTGEHDGMKAVIRCATDDDVVDALVATLRPGDALLVKGSRGARMETIVDAYRATLLDAAPSAS
jgi:UDP-N-acetylmuramoyl-tripeptide--D-alanyl-D-alanine ligase